MKSLGRRRKRSKLTELISLVLISHSTLMSFLANSHELRRRRLRCNRMRRMSVQPVPTWLIRSFLDWYVFWLRFKYPTATN